MTISQFESLKKEERNEYLKNNLNSLDIKFVDDLLGEYSFSEIDGSIQVLIINKYVDHIKTYNSEKILDVWANINDDELIEKMFIEFNIEKILEYQTFNNICYFLGKLKNDELAKKVLTNEVIYKKIFEPVEHREGGMRHTSYPYNHIDELSIGVQRFIIEESLKLAKEDEAREELLAEVDDELKKEYLVEIPNKMDLLLAYIRLTKSVEAKEILKTRLYEIYNLDYLLDLYPDSFTIEEMAFFIEKIDIERMTYSNFPDEILPFIKQKILNEKGKDIFNLIKKMQFSDDDLVEIFDSISKKNIYENMHMESVQRYLIKKISEDPNYIEDKDEFVFLAIKKIYGSYSGRRTDIESLKGYVPDEVYLMYGEDKNYIIEIIKSNPSLMPYLRNEYAILDLIKFGEIDLVKNISFNTLLNVYMYNKNDVIKNILLEKLNTNNYIGEMEEIFTLKQQIYVDYKYSPSGMAFDLFIDKLNDKEIEMLIANVQNFKILMEINKNSNNKYLDIIIEKLINSDDSIISSLNIYDLDKILNGDKERYNEIMRRFSPNKVLALFNKKTTIELEAEIIRKFNDNNFIFNGYEDSEIVFEKLSSGYKKYILSSMNLRLKEKLINSPKLYEIVSKNETILNYKLIEELEKGTFENKRNYDLLIQLFENNPFVASTINYELFTEEFNNLNFSFFLKVTKYPEIQKRLIDLKKDSEEFDLFKQIIAKINLDEDKIFDRKLMILLDYFEQNEIRLSENINDIEIDNLTRYILLSSNTFQFSSNHLDLSGIDILNIDKSLSDKCDKEYEKSNSLVDKKNLIFIKYFDMTYSDVQEFIRMYDNNKDGVEISLDAINFLNNLKNIMNITNTRELDEYYVNNNIKYTINDIMFIENEFQKAYTKSIEDSMYKGNGTKKKIIIDGEEIEVTVLDGDFKLLTHSTNAYASMPMIDDNYFKSWNLSKKTNNHGICTAMVSNHSLGLPPLSKTGQGCIFAFTSFGSEAITNMAPYDLCTINNEYQLKTSRPLIYSSADDLLSSTRHSHNELVLERKNLKDNSSNYIQPSYVIITNEMTEEQKKNAVKAAREMNPPEGLPILYYDYNLIISNCDTEIRNMIKEFESSKDLNTLAEIINLFESIKSTLRVENEYPFISNEEINNVINNYINYCKENNMYEELSRLESILNYEQSKYDLVIDSGNRAKKINIDFEGFIEKLNASNLSYSSEDITKEYVEAIKESMKISTPSIKGHSIDHSSRVVVLTQLLANEDGLSEEEKDILRIAALYHDSGRKDNSKDDNHGIMGAERAIKELSGTYDELTISIISSMIEYHAIDDDNYALEQIMDKYNIPEESRAEVYKLSMYLKDADALDRVRIEKIAATLNPNKLRLKSSRRHIKTAKELYELTNEIDLDKIEEYETQKGAKI